MDELRLVPDEEEEEDLYSGFPVFAEEDRQDFISDSYVREAVRTSHGQRRARTVTLTAGAAVETFGAPLPFGVSSCYSAGAADSFGAAPGANVNRSNAYRSLDVNENESEPNSSSDLTSTRMNRISTTRGAGFRTGTGGGRATLSRAGPSVTRQGTATRPGTASERPMTAIMGAGFRSKMATMDEHPASSYEVPDLEVKLDEEEKKKKSLEKKIRRMCQKCAFLSTRGRAAAALDLAKAAGKLERSLSTLSAAEQEQSLTFMVLTNLSLMYAGCGAFMEAISANRVIIKARTFDPLWRMKTKLNTGVLYFRLQKYEKALKLFRMALDAIKDEDVYVMKDLKRKCKRNIALCFIKMRHYKEASRDLELNMKEAPDFENGFNLILSHWAQHNDKEAMKAFQLMLQTKLGVDLNEDKYQEKPNDKAWNSLLEAIRGDTLRVLEREKITKAHHFIVYATKIIAKYIQETHAKGFDWCIEQVKASVYRDIAAEIEIGKAIHFLKEKDTESATKTLKAFERHDHKLNCAAAINLSFLYFHERDYTQAAKYVDVAIEADRYNPAALVNKGVIFFREGKFEKAREFFKEAIGTESTSVEALYDLGLANKALAWQTKDDKYYDDALEVFLKLHNIIRGYPPVIYQIADLCERQRHFQRAAEWFLQLQGLLPTDPGCLRRLGHIYDEDFKDKANAFQYHMDSYRFFPSELETIQWLGAYYIESSYWERAIEYFERAVLIQPDNVVWYLSIGSCYRRSGNYAKALETFKRTRSKFPENQECLKALTKLASDLGLPEAEEFQEALREMQERENQSKGRRNKSGNRIIDSSADDDSSSHSSFSRRKNEEKIPSRFDRQREIERQLEMARVSRRPRPSAIDAILNGDGSIDDEDDDVDGDDDQTRRTIQYNESGFDFSQNSSPRRSHPYSEPADSASYCSAAPNSVATSCAAAVRRRGPFEDDDDDDDDEDDLLDSMLPM